MDICVQTMKPEHIPAVTGLEKALFGDAWNEQSLENTLYYRPDTSLIATVENCVAGYLFFMVAADEGELLRIGVADSFRRQGIARALMAYMDQYVRENGIYSVWLEVREHNTPARTLYENGGFQVRGTRRNYYRNPGEDAVIMCKNYH